MRSEWCMTYPLDGKQRQQRHRNHHQRQLAVLVRILALISSSSTIVLIIAKRSLERERGELYYIARCCQYRSGCEEHSHILDSRLLFPLQIPTLLLMILLSLYYRDYLVEDYYHQVGVIIRRVSHLVWSGSS